MATFRQIHIKIWKDGWFLELPASHKLLFIYLFSNERANLFGLYDLPLRVICFEADLDLDTVTDGLARFADEGKAFYQDGWIWVRSLLSYNVQNLKSPKTRAHLGNVLAEIPDIPLKRRAIAYYQQKFGYQYPLEGVSMPILQEQEQEQHTEQEQEQHQEQDGVAAAVQAMEAHGMTNAQDVLTETALTPAQLLGNVSYAKAQGLGAGWLRTEARQNRAHAPPDASQDRRRFIEADYVQH